MTLVLSIRLSHAQEPLAPPACEGANNVLRDPPRSGAGAVIAWLIERQLEWTVYDPTALIQAFKVLPEAGV